MDELGLVYLDIYKNLKAEVFPDGFITRKKIYKFLGLRYHINKGIRSSILKEMEGLKFVKIKSRGFIIIDEGINIQDLIDKKVMEIKKKN